MSEQSMMQDFDTKVDHTKQVYTDRRVKISDWELARESEPKDNDPYSPPHGSYFLSTHHRLGWDERRPPQSETHAMLAQIKLLKQNDAQKRKKSTMNFKTYCDKEEEPSDPAESGLAVFPADYGMVDYCSTMKKDFVPQDPKPTKPFVLPHFPAHLNRNVLSELNDASSLRRRGYNMFMDDSKDDFYALKKLRATRGNVSFDPTKLIHVYGNCPLKKEL